MKQETECFTILLSISEIENPTSFLTVLIIIAIINYKNNNIELSYLQTSLLLEKREDLITSGAIQAYVPAALIRVVFSTSRARPKSVIFRVLLDKLLLSTTSFSKTASTSKTQTCHHLLSDFKCSLFCSNDTSATTTIILTLKGAILNWLQTTHCLMNCLQVQHAC